MHHFDYESIAREAGIHQKKLEELCQIIRQEFPQDDMMYELHLLRVCVAIKEGHVTIDEALRSEEAA